MALICHGYLLQDQDRRKETVKNETEAKRRLYGLNGERGGEETARLSMYQTVSFLEETAAGWIIVSCVVQVRTRSTAPTGNRTRFEMGRHSVRRLLAACTVRALQCGRRTTAERGRAKSCIFKSTHIHFVHVANIQLGARERRAREKMKDEVVGDGQGTPIAPPDADGHRHRARRQRTSESSVAGRQRVRQPIARFITQLPPGRCSRYDR
uniref:Uncharacterized protein n=1 Tax=Plectus sambesii TaxID=2011161 RepID=A0A914UP54_9BILA